MWPTFRRLLASLSILTAFMLACTALAPGAGAAPSAAGVMASGCGPNPSPPTGEPTIQVYNPLAGQRVASPIRVVGQAVAFEASFGIALYDQNGAELNAITATTAASGVLSPFDARIPYRVAAPQDGCLWLYNRSGADGGRINVVQVPVRLTQVVKACFREVGDLCIEDPFRDYWESNGGLAQFGFLLASGFREVEADGNTYWVQYFERARFEWHPENAPPYDVLLGLLGNEITTERRVVREALFAPARARRGAIRATVCTSGESLWFAATGTTSVPLRATTGRATSPARDCRRWRSTGDLAVYGYPISEVFLELGYDGDFHYVQYFERHRLEYHPVNQAPYDILLGQLGRQIYMAKYGAR
ncbi:MAG: Gmad2 immunoglobulin-like domain-containing protein [Chloroflexia bacterium]